MNKREPNASRTHLTPGGSAEPRFRPMDGKPEESQATAGNRVGVNALGIETSAIRQGR